MLRIDCPVCGMRDHSEFSYGEDASVAYPEMTNTDRQAWYEAVFLRDNPRGLHRERWHHVQGCRQWLIVERDTVTHDISSVALAHPKAANMLKTPRKSPKHKAVAKAGSAAQKSADAAAQKSAGKANNGASS